jgi:hypothetical protein
VEVLGGGLKVGMAEEFLDGADVDAVVDQMRWTGVAKLVCGSPLFARGLSACGFSEAMASM